MSAIVRRTLGVAMALLLLYPLVGCKEKSKADALYDAFPLPMNLRLGMTVVEVHKVSDLAEPDERQTSGNGSFTDVYLGAELWGEPAILYLAYFDCHEALSNTESVLSSVTFILDPHTANVSAVLRAFDEMYPSDKPPRIAEDVADVSLWKSSVTLQSLEKEYGPLSEKYFMKMSEVTKNSFESLLSRYELHVAMDDPLFSMAIRSHINNGSEGVGPWSFISIGTEAEYFLPWIENIRQLSE